MSCASPSGGRLGRSCQMPELRTSEQITPEAVTDVVHVQGRDRGAGLTTAAMDLVRLQTRG